MDPNPTPFPGKNQAKQKPNRRRAESSKPVFKVPSMARKNRIFGTVRSSNIPPAKILATEKPAVKPAFTARKHPEWNPTTRVPIPEPTKKKKSSSENPKPKPAQIEEDEEAKEKIGIVTPVKDSPIEPKSGGSAFQSAKICSKCRFDRLETASYWVTQIKLSESVGKHFVSAAFFRLAHESGAEPMKKLRSELTRYLAQNRNLGGQTEWRNVCVSYGVLKDERPEMKSEEPVTENLETPKATKGVFEDEQRRIALFVEKMKEVEI